MTAAMKRILLFIMAATLAAAAEKPFTGKFAVAPGEWSSTCSNAYFILEPGRTLVLEGKEGGKHTVLTVTVLDETVKVAGVETRVVEERETVNGQLVELSRNYFAASTKTKDIYYFGEDVDMYRNGKLTGHAGSWRAGEKGATFGFDDARHAARRAAVLPGVGGRCGARPRRDHQPD